MRKESPLRRIAVIGGGPAGVFAAIGAKDHDPNAVVVLYEKNEKIGKKLYITGKGRCNFTNRSPMETFFEQVNRNAKFLYSSFYALTNIDLIHLLEDAGLKSKTERGNRVFPASDKSSDVIKALMALLDQKGVELRLRENIRTLQRDGESFRVNGRERYDAVVVATGGLSYPSTGSTGDGYRFAADFGHAIEPRRPSLVGLETVEDWPQQLQGLSLRNIGLRLREKKKTICDEFGEMIFTHYGVSGPAALRVSCFVKQETKQRLEIDLKPALSIHELDARILRDFEVYTNKTLMNGLVDLLPGALIPVVIAEAQLNPQKKIHQLSKEERQSLTRTLKNLTLHIKACRPFTEAIVTAGGVSVKQVNSSSMESKLVPGLFFAGELLDVDAMTGGYNLQIAFSTGYLAGKSSALYKKGEFS